MSNYIKQVEKKWEEVLNFEGASKITDDYKRQVTALLLENQVKEVAEGEKMALFEDPNISNDLQGSASNIDRFDPILISLVRRAAPMMIAFDVCGVQPMNSPVGLIFSLKSGYANSSDGFVAEALFNEANTAYAGNANSSVEDFSSGVYSANSSVNDHIITGSAASTLIGETDEDWPQMGFSLEKKSVTARTRRLKADYTYELLTDLKNVNNVDAEKELANILSTEILFEINREIIRTIYNIAKPGGTTNTGLVNLDSSSGDIDGRYFLERWRGLHHLIDVDAIKIQKDTRRGRGNFVILDAETASALANIGILDYSLVSKQAALANQPDETMNTFVGMLGNKKVFVDPYVDIGTNFYVVGYKGSSPYDAGLFYAPYVPLTKYQVVRPTSFQPSMGFKTRYGLTEHPFVGATTYVDNPTADNAHLNYYYRVSNISNLRG